MEIRGRHLSLTTLVLLVLCLCLTTTTVVLAVLYFTWQQQFTATVKIHGQFEIYLDEACTQLLDDTQPYDLGEFNPIDVPDQNYYDFWVKSKANVPITIIWSMFDYVAQGWEYDDNNIAYLKPSIATPVWAVNCLVDTTWWQPKHGTNPKVDYTYTLNLTNYGDVQHIQLRVNAYQSMETAPVSFSLLFESVDTFP